MIMQRLQAKNALHVDLVRQADPEAAGRAEEEAHPGLTFTPEERRVYPSGVAAQVLGTVDIESKGLAGLEHQYDGELQAGATAREQHVRDPQGDTISVVSSQPAQPGQTLALTLDRDIQAVAEEVLRRTQLEFEGGRRHRGRARPHHRRRAGHGLQPGPGPGGYRTATPTSSASARSPTSTSPARPSRP